MGAASATPEDYVFQAASRNAGPQPVVGEQTTAVCCRSALAAFPGDRVPAPLPPSSGFNPATAWRSPLRQSICCWRPKKISPGLQGLASLPRPQACWRPAHGSSAFVARGSRVLAHKMTGFEPRLDVRLVRTVHCQRRHGKWAPLKIPRHCGCWGWWMQSQTAPCWVRAWFSF